MALGASTEKEGLLFEAVCELAEAIETLANECDSLRRESRSA